MVSFYYTYKIASKALSVVVGTIIANNLCCKSENRGKKPISLDLKQEVYGNIGFLSLNDKVMELSIR